MATGLRFSKQIFRSNQTVTVVSLMRQLPRLQRKHYTHTSSRSESCQRASNRQDSPYESHHSKQWYSMVCQSATNACFVTGSFNLAGSFVEMRGTLTSKKESRLHSERMDDDQSLLAMTSKRDLPKRKS